MAVVACVRQPGEGFGEIQAIFDLDRFANINKGRLALVLDELCERNALEYGIELRSRGKALSHLLQFVICERHSNEPAVTFNERFPAEQTSTQPPLEIPEAKKEQNVTTTTRIVSAKRARSRVVVRPRWSFDIR